MLLAVGTPVMGDIKLWEVNRGYMERFCGMRETAWKDRQDVFSANSTSSAG